MGDDRRMLRLICWPTRLLAAAGASGYLARTADCKSLQRGRAQSRGVDEALAFAFSLWADEIITLQTTASGRAIRGGVAD